MWGHEGNAQSIAPLRARSQPRAPIMAPMAVYESLEPIPTLLEALDVPLPLGPDGLLHGKLDNGMT